MTFAFFSIRIRAYFKIYTKHSFSIDFKRFWLNHNTYRTDYQRRYAEKLSGFAT